MRPTGQLPMPLLLQALILLLVASNAATNAASVIERLLPANVIAGAAITVTNLVNPGAEVLVYAIEESVPTGWSISQVNSFGSVDLEQGKIKWGPFFDNQPRVLTYRLRPPTMARGEIDFSGMGSFNGATVPITGATRMRVSAGEIPGGSNEIISRLPPLYLPGGTLNLTNQVRLASETLVYAIEDQVPKGWQIGEVNHGGQFDAAAGKIKWGPFFDRVERELICELKPPNSSTGLVTFAGLGSFDGEEIAVGGNRQRLASLSTVVREMPAQFQPSERISVTLVATPAPKTTVFAIQESIPKGWSVGEISHDGTFDPQLRTMKWGPFFTDANTRITYTATAPDAVTNGLATFAGLAVFDGLSVPIIGQGQLMALASQVVREMSAEFLAGTPLTITNRAIPDVTVTTYAVEDEVPVGWIVESMSHDGKFDVTERKVKWGPFFDREHRLLTCTLMSPANVQGTVFFKGTGSFNGLGARIAGRQETRAVSLASLNSIVRSLAASVRVGRWAGVTNRVFAAEGISVHAIEDQVPSDWTATNISHSGAFDSREGKVKWGPFFDATARELTYQLSPSPRADGSATFTGAGSFNGARVPTSGASTIVAIANHNPVAREDSFERLATESITMRASSLLSNDSDPEGDPLSLIEVAAASSAGVPIGYANGQITYLPATVFDQSDSFTYKISDGFGGDAVGSVKLVVIKPGPSANRVGLETLPSGSVRLRFVGIPGRRYRIEAAESLATPAWATLASRVASVRGDFELEDLDAPRFAVRFYRTVSP